MVHKTKKQKVGAPDATSPPNNTTSSTALAAMDIDTPNVEVHFSIPTGCDNIEKLILLSMEEDIRCGISHDMISLSNYLDDHPNFLGSTNRTTIGGSYPASIIANAVCIRNPLVDPLDLHYADIDINHGQFTANNDDLLSICFSSIKYVEVGDMKINTIQCTNLNPHTLLVNNDINITACCFDVVFENDGKIHITVHTLPCFWDFIIAKSTDRCVEVSGTGNNDSQIRAVYKAYQHGFQFELDEDYDITCGTISGLSMGKFAEMEQYYHDFPFKGYDCVQVSGRNRYYLVAKHPTASIATPQDDTKAYAEFVKTAYNENANNHGGRFIHSLTQAPRNEAQQNVYSKFQDYCLEIITFCIENNVVLLPGSYLMNFLNLAMVSIDNPKAHLYWEEYLKKIGNTGNGGYRTKKYNEQFEKSGIDVDPSLMSCMDIESLPVHLQTKLTELILDGLERFVPEEIPDTCTFEQALEMEMKGLPIMTQLTFWSMIKSLAECKMLGGAIELQSFLKRLYLNILESGLQKYLNVKSPSEFANSNAFGYILSRDEEINYDADDWFGKLTPDEQQQFVQAVAKGVIFLLTWPPGKRENHRAKFKHAKIAIAERVCGEGNWRDSYDQPPVPKPKCAADVYAWERFTLNQKRLSVIEKEKDVDPVEQVGGVAAADKDALGMSVTGMTLVQYIMKRRPFGEDGPRWFIHHR